MGFVYALLFGDRSRLGVQEVKLFKETGTMLICGKWPSHRYCVFNI